mgnify:CR=1 FL=1
MANQAYPMAVVTQDSLDSYIRTVNSYPMLTADEERGLAERLHYDGEIEAAKGLILSHLRFVVHVARGYSGYGLPMADLVQEGNIGLMKAVKRFNPEVGVRLVSFAVHWIKAEIHEFILRNWRIVKVATTKAQRKLFFNLRSSKKRLGWLSQTEARKIADDLGVKEETVYQMEGRLTAQDMGFDAGNDDEDSAYQAPAHTLEDSRYDPAKEVEHANYESDANERLHAALADLDDRSKDILTQRWLNDDKSTLHELADKYGVSAERIRQLEKNAMKKVRVVLEAGGVEV